MRFIFFRYKYETWKPHGWTDELQKDLLDFEMFKNPQKVCTKNRFGKESDIIGL